MSRMSSISVWSSRLTRRKGQWTVDEGLLRTLIPLNLLDATQLRGLIGRSQVVKLRAGAQVSSSPGDRRTVYLLSGIVEILSGQQVDSVVAAGTEASRHPLLGANSVGMAVRAKMDTTLLKVAVDTDELMFQSGFASDYEVSDIDSATGTDWLTRFLQAKVFTRLPPSNIQKLLARMEEVEVHAGQVIMRQDETDDYYYIVKEGVCRVTTRPPAGGDELYLTELHEGDGFGEDALITNGRRGATVTMIDDGRLMRLVKDDFTSLLVEPVLRYLTWDEAQALAGDGAILLDVRQPDEAARADAGAVNIPLGLLRSKSHELDSSRIHITVSNVLNRSSAAAFLLCQQGIDAYILQDGARALPTRRIDAEPVPGPMVVPEPSSVSAPQTGGLTLVQAPPEQPLPDPAPPAQVEPAHLTLVPLAPVVDEPAEPQPASQPVCEAPAARPDEPGLLTLLPLAPVIDGPAEPQPVSQPVCEAPAARPDEPGPLTLVPPAPVVDEPADPGPDSQRVHETPPMEELRVSMEQELETLKSQLAREASRRVQAEGRLKDRDGQLRTLQGHLEQSRARLRKVVALARVTEAKRRELQAGGERLEAQSAAMQQQVTALHQQVTERERRLAETELERRKLERTLSVLRARQSTAPPVARYTPMLPVAAAAAPVPRSERGQGQDIVPPESAVPAERGGRVRRAARYGVWALVLLVLLGATGITLYDTALGHRYVPSAQAGSRAQSAAPGTETSRAPSRPGTLSAGAD